MVVTDRFVYIHMPKTGGTFVTDVLTRLHAPRRRRSRWRRWRKLLTGRAANASRYGPLLNLEPKHGTCHDIPEEHAHLPLVSNARNPFDWYVSQYEFGWWKRTFEYFPEPNPTPVGWAIETALPGFESDHPEFPEIPFEAFVELCERASDLYNDKAGEDVGLLTHGFIRYFFKDPASVIAALDREYMRSGTYQRDMFPVHFLRTHHLNRNLYDALLARGYARKDVDFIPGLAKILPMGRGRGEGRPWESYYTPELRARIREREWLLFEMFPEFDAQAERTTALGAQ